MFDAAEKRQQIPREWLHYSTVCLEAVQEKSTLGPTLLPSVEQVYAPTLITHFD